MTNIDKLIFSFHITQFETIQNALENDSNNNDFDFDDYIALQGAYHQFGRTKLQRVDLKDIKTHFRENHWVYVDNKKIGILHWGSYGTSKNYGYLTFSNQTFYNGDWVLYKQALQDLSLTIHNISRLDIAFDSTINPTKRYRKIVRDKENEIVINGIRIRDRREMLNSPYFLTHGCLDEPLECPQIHFSTSDKSTLCRTYNKSEEVATHSHKIYITDLFESKEKCLDSNIYRCEISMNSKILSRIVGDDIGRFLEKLEDEYYLLALHRDSMMRLFRYSKGGGKRKTLLSYYIRH